MKVTKSPNAVLSGHITSECQPFTADMNAHMVRTITDKLYTDKDTAVLRELMSNAIDATIEARAQRLVTENPVVIFPSKANRFHMSVIDHGLGMSHEFTMRTYSSFFTSTKTDTNIATGMYGLGSKSPFALTDQFNVETATQDDVDRGVVRMYTCAKDADGMPMIHFIGENQTDTPHTGTIVSFFYAGCSTTPSELPTRRYLRVDHADIKLCDITPYTPLLNAFENMLPVIQLNNVTIVNANGEALKNIVAYQSNPLLPGMLTDKAYAHNMIMWDSIVSGKRGISKITGTN